MEIANLLIKIIALVLYSSCLIAAIYEITKNKDVNKAIYWLCWAILMQFILN